MRKTRKKPSKHYGLELTIICAARYAVERESYMTPVVVRFMRDSLHRMSTPSLQELLVEIPQRLSSYHQYKREWSDLLSRISEEIKRRDT